MSSSNQRSPRDLRLMVSDSQQDLQEMQDSLSKLKALKQEDKSEMAMLRSRIEDQSKLIMILKQRADEEIIRAQTLDKINQDLSEFREKADEMLKYEVRKFNQLEHRFNTLSSNHEEMIKFKDEYKRVNKELREENLRLKSENAQLFSKAIQEKEAKIQELDKKLAIVKMESLNVESKFKQMQAEWRGRDESLRQELRDLVDSTAAQTQELQHRAQQAEERLKGAQNKLQNHEEARKHLEQDFHGKLSSLTKERDELLDLTMQRGKLIQKEQGENKRLHKRVEEMEKEVQATQARFERDAATVNTNLQVRKLREELAQSQGLYHEIVKEFDAFKKHTSNLLKQEKELNERLRHLAG